MSCEVYKSNEKRSLLKKEAEKNQLYALSSNSDQPAVQELQREKRTTASVWQLSQKPKIKKNLIIKLSHLKPACDTAPQSVLEQTKSKYSDISCEVYNSNENRWLLKKETEKDQLNAVRPVGKCEKPEVQEKQSEKRIATSVGQLSQKPENSTEIKIKHSMASEGPAFDLFGINRKNKAINTYGKARNNTTCTATNTTTSMAKRSKFGSLSDRLQLIDTTPTGEDPYQPGEADLSELSPIPKVVYSTTCTATNTTTSVAKRSKFGSLSDRLQLIDATPTGEPYQPGEADLRELSPIPKVVYSNFTCTATSTTTSVAKRSKFSSLSDRLQLIDATPTGEDPYQLREADFSDLPPIPKLILRKTNHGRMKVLNQPSRRIYDPTSPEPKTTKRTSCCLSNNFATDLEKEAKTMIIQKSNLDLVKTEPEIDWWIYLSKTIEDTQSIAVKYSVSDSCRNPASSISLDCNEFQQLFTSDSALNLQELNIVTTLSSPAILPYEQPKKQVPSPKDMLAQFEAIINKL